MGLYLNPGNQTFQAIVNSDIYVDKTGLISYLNSRIGKNRPYIASSRPRRFGKTMAVHMLTAYYSKGYDSKALFAPFEIAKDNSFEEHLNQYDVIQLDIQWMRGIALDKIKQGEATTVLNYIQNEVIHELYLEYPQYINENETSLASALSKINLATGSRFILLIDEWDCVFREEKDNVALQNEYIDLLRGLFKGSIADRFVALAYITGILPIKKYGTQSALNNFNELTMLEPAALSEYIGFSESEVKSLCDKHNMPFDEMQKWYDGYYFENVGHVYSPNSVVTALERRKFKNYWTQTKTYESLKAYIDMDFDGLKQKIVAMLGGQRCKIDPETFQNDMTTFQSSDDVLTLLIHLGYIAYDDGRDEIFIPNEEVRNEIYPRGKKQRMVRIYSPAGNILLVGISYDKKSREHHCMIEKAKR